MPSTINGIGTHYYGKKNNSTRTDACKSCGKVSVLESYDTRLWFVIVFIPVIPLGRKRIMDKCPRCTRHYALDLHKYEQARQLQISSALERFRREQSPEAVLEAHGQLLAFLENDQAAQFRATALEKYPAHAPLRAQLAAQLEHAASYAESSKLYEAALKQDPELPEARVGVARRRMVEGELDEARRLLGFLEVPGAGQLHAIGPLDVLSGYFQKAGRHDDALALATVLLREIPAAGHQHAFRSFVRRSEKALGRFESILPPGEHSLRGLFRSEDSPYPPWLRKLVIGVGAVALLVAGLLINNEYIRRHRSINVVNACGQPVRIQVDNQPPVEFSGNGLLSVSEGRHHIRMTGAVEQALDVDLQAGFFQRWSSKPLWVLSPGGEAVLQESTVIYAENPQPGSQRLLVGQPFVALAHVDYPFEQPPHQLKLDSKGQQVTKTAFQWIQGLDNEAFLQAYATDTAGAIAFAERRLLRDPNNRKLFDSYLSHTLPQQAKHVEELLKTGLNRRPVAVRWHRAYQAVVEMNGHQHELVPYYDSLLKSEPESGALIYLRGRIDTDWQKKREYYQKTIKADPKLSWPWMGIGAQCAAEARWSESLINFKKARELGADPEYVQDGLHVAGLATGGAEGLAAEYQGRLAASAMDFAAVPLLTDALIASGHPERAERAINDWAVHLDQSIRPILTAMMHATALYQSGKLAECVESCRQNPQLNGNVYRLQALLALGRSQEAIKDPAFEKLWVGPWIALSASLGLSLDGKKVEAAQWLERGCSNLATLSSDFRRMAQLLRSDKPPTVESISQISMDAENRALVFALLAGRFPEKKSEYDTAAARFNISRKFPYQLVQRALGRLKPASP
jgi:tetratricopeptide (TPR) repeat protein